MHNVEIKAVLNGWSVIVGCQTVVFNEAKSLCAELEAYLANPDVVIKRYMETSVNRNLVRRPAEPQAIREMPQAMRAIDAVPENTMAPETVGRRIR